MVGQIQVTIGTSATQVTSSKLPVCWARFEGDDGNSNPVFIGDSTVTTANGQRLHNSATSPEDMVIGPFDNNYLDLSEIYVAGTQNELVNVLYVTN